MKKFGVNISVMIAGIICSLLGVLFLFKDIVGVLTNILFYVVGFLLIVEGILGIVFGVKSNVKSLMIIGAIDLIIGVVLMFYHGTLLNILFAVLLVVLPIIRIVQTKDKKMQLKKEFPKFVLAIILFLISLGGISKILSIIVGVVLISIGLVLVIGSFYKNKIVNE